MLNRRGTLAAMAGALLLRGTALPAAQPRSTGGQGEPFSWEQLKRLALRVAQQSWRPRPAVAAAGAIDFDEANRISFRADRALWRGDGDRETRFFPVHKFANLPVAISEVRDGREYPFAFAPGLFDVKPDRDGKRFPLAPGFAGFRLMNANGRGDWLAFQGASYFRSAGALDQYGLSARGLAINTGIDGREEFPSFTRFWLERGPGEAVTVYALLEGPSVVGAYRFVNRKTAKGPVQEVSLSAQLRRDVERLGFAPLTSMFWYGEGNRQAAIDWRPEIHDSDGLALFTGSGERIWRPLDNPARPTTNSFADVSPRGFGLLQRDRAFANYQDDGAFYEKRPNLWVEPVGDWGPGAVMLYEIPTRREIEDNIVAFWTPSAPARAGNRYEFEYRLSWSAADPAPPALARAVDCWTGTAGRPGHEPTAGARRLVADFAGDNLKGLNRGSGVEAVVSVDGGKAIATHAYPVVDVPGRWRLIVDVAPLSGEPSHLRAYLRHAKGALSETLLYELR